jgi:hypothetical protein
LQNVDSSFSKEALEKYDDGSVQLNEIPKLLSKEERKTETCEKEATFSGKKHMQKGLRYGNNNMERGTHSSPYYLI